MVFFAFSLPRPRSQRFPVMNLRPPLKWLMVRRQVFVHPRHLVIVVEYSMSLISSMESMVVPSQSVYRSRAMRAAPKAPMMPAMSGRMASQSAIFSKLRRTALL